MPLQIELPSRTGFAPNREIVVLHIHNDAVQATPRSSILECSILSIIRPRWPCQPLAALSVERPASPAQIARTC